MHAEAKKLRLGVLISGGGTNLQSILNAIELGELDAQVAVVISNRGDAYGLERARLAGVPAVFLDPKGYATLIDYNHALRETLDEHGVEAVIMAGYMRLLGREVLEAFPSRVLNIHPALLPSFPGASGVADAWKAGVKVTGVTVHFADEKFDEGPIIAQEVVRIEEDDTVAMVEARIHSVEHRIYPAAIQLLAQDRIRVEGRRVRVLPRGDA
ncbi:MAG: phosphoribosylglycinamide formyltransferase [Coriobacteriia bacterium]|nr:phosphoribosylglycinamide formyltransferase [Coriobacteriia bacterium]